MPEYVIKRVFTSARPVPCFFAYIEWFTAFEDRFPHHGLYCIKRKFQNGFRVAAVLPLGNIHRGVHLFPSFGGHAPDHWTSGNVMDECDTFFVNSFSDRHAYHIFG